MKNVESVEALRLHFMYTKYQLPTFYSAYKSPTTIKMICTHREILNVNFYYVTQRELYEARNVNYANWKIPAYNRIWCVPLNCTKHNRTNWSCG